MTAPTGQAARTAAALVDRVVSDYLAAWNTADPSARARHLRAAFSEDGSYCAPAQQAQGRAGMEDCIRHFRSSNPGARIVVLGGIAHHGGRLRVAWAWLDAGGGVTLRGSDFAELDPQGRIGRLTVFYDAPDDAPGAQPLSTGCRLAGCSAAAAPLRGQR